eukprot:jgi/Galph1/3888/GphlegSOOS_G2510.1
MASAQRRRRRKKAIYQSSQTGDKIESASPEVHPKYLAQRFRLFSLFDEGIRLSDPESWYSVLPEKIAAHVASRCRCDVLADPFAGAGGSTIQFAKTCNFVIAIDIVPSKVYDAKHNAQIYGVADKVDFIIGDAFQLFPGLAKKVDVMFLAPPWGGPDYENGDFFDFKRFVYDISTVLDAATRVTPNVAISLPRTCSPRHIAELVPVGQFLEVEYNYLNDKCKTITVYLGNLIDRKLLMNSLSSVQSFSTMQTRQNEESLQDFETTDNVLMI